MRLGKQFSLDITDEIDTIYGITNRLNPQVIFINGKFWIQPTQEMDYETILGEIISSLRLKIKQALKQTPRWENIMIFDMDIKTLSMSPIKKNYGDFELYIKQDKKNIISPALLKDDIIQLLTPIINNFIKQLNENHFIISKNKK
jgi:hypothetical protein